MKYHPPLAHKNARLFQKYLRKEGIPSRFQYVGRGARVYVGAFLSFVGVSASGHIATHFGDGSTLDLGPVDPEAFDRAVKRYTEALKVTAK